eukprot:365856-Chlamydomonas_euryale.AAC.2
MAARCRYLFCSLPGHCDFGMIVRVVKAAGAAPEGRPPANVTIEWTEAALPYPDTVVAYDGDIVTLVWEGEPHDARAFVVQAPVPQGKRACGCVGVGVDVGGEA